MKPRDMRNIRIPERPVLGSEFMFVTDAFERPLPIVLPCNRCNQYLKVIESKGIEVPPKSFPSDSSLTPNKKPCLLPS